MLFAIFLISVVALEVILRHDEKVERKSKRIPIPHTPLPDSSVHDASGVLTLAKAIEQHGRESQRPVRQSSLIVSSTDVTSAGSRPLK